MNDTTFKNEDSPLFKGLQLEALEIQNAVNLSGLVHKFSQVMTRLWEVDRANENIGTSWINSNSVTRLWISKFVSLTGEPKVSDWTVPELC